MAERHKKALAKWDARREVIIEEQRKNWLAVLKAVTDVVEQKPSTATDSAADSFKIQTYSDYVKQKLENGQLSELLDSGINRSLTFLTIDYFLQKQLSEPGESHTLNFRRYVPFSTGYKKPNHHILLAKGTAPIKVINEFFLT